MITIAECISEIEQEILRLEGSLRVYKDLAAKGVSTILVPEIKKEPQWALPKSVKVCECTL